MLDKRGTVVGCVRQGCGKLTNFRTDGFFRFSVPVLDVFPTSRRLVPGARGTNLHAYN
jgi:hypothetical protein